MIRARPAALALAAAGYAVAAWTVAPGFYDGLAPPAPYRWMSPPSQLASGNLPPQPGQGSVSVESKGVVDPGSIYTQDSQASISFVPGAFVAPANRAPVTFDLRPVASFPNPGDVRLVTNVYCITGSAPLAPGRDVLITLQYSSQTPAPSDVYRYQGSGPWQNIGSTGSAAPFSIAARAMSLGCFAGGYPAPGSRPAAQGPGPNGGQTLPVVVALALLAVLLAGIPLALLRRRAGDEEDE